MTATHSGETSSPPSAGKPGKVFLVGAGPGDPGLVTLRGVECLRRADLVLYDYLVNPRIVRHAERAEKICLGRHGQGRIMPQEEVNAAMIAAARAGKAVVRLKGGDPAVFARGAEEAGALAEAKIKFEIVPGVTAALAAASYAGIPVTCRGIASAVALVTAHEEGEKDEPAVDFAALAAFPGTLVMYMGVTTAESWTRALIAAGKPAKTPAAIIRRCSWPDQLTIRCTLGRVADELRRRHLRPPVIVVVGDVVPLGETLDWFSRRPLFGRRVLVTRAAGQADILCDKLEDAGATVLAQPAIEIGPPDDFSPVDRAIGRLDQYQAVVFSSANGVRFFLERLSAMGRDVRALGRAQLAAIGPATGEELERYHLRVDVPLPDEFRAEALADRLIASLAQGGTKMRVLLIRASRGREVLAERLRAAGHDVEQVVAYSSRDVANADAEIRAALAAGKIDWITVTSSAIARSLAGMLGDELGRAKLASISPITSAELRALGHVPAVEAVAYTTDGLIEAICSTDRADGAT
ncbi:MAG: uroporphyrinogen-III C-methyltransferase [Planctomycetia bacterium]|nr:uroporphyrinogen-III C-methyltransferase [Planctomycetia bacterium]